MKRYHQLFLNIVIFSVIYVDQKNETHVNDAFQRDRGSKIDQN